MADYVNQTVSNYDQLVSLFKYLKQFLTGEILHIIIKPWKPKRSLSQNNLMWMWNQEIAQFINEHGGLDEIEYTSDDIHEILVMDFWGKKCLYNPFTEKQMETRFETKKFTVAQMTNHLEKMEFYAAQHHIPLTQPHDYTYAMTGKKD